MFNYSAAPCAPSWMISPRYVSFPKGITLVAMAISAALAKKMSHLDFSWLNHGLSTGVIDLFDCMDLSINGC